MMTRKMMHSKTEHLRSISGKQTARARSADKQAEVIWGLHHEKRLEQRRNRSGIDSSVLKIIEVIVF